MGTQQILLIVLSVIIVGVAIAVGITMFRNQAYNSNKTAVAGELQQYASQAVQWFKTPVSQGGAGAPADLTTDFAIADVAAFIGFDNTTYKLDTESGVYKVTGVNALSVELTAYGKEVKNGVSPKFITTVTFPDGTIASVPSDEALPGAF